MIQATMEALAQKVLRTKNSDINSHRLIVWIFLFTLCVFPKTTSTENCLSYDFLQKSFDILPLHFQIITNNGEIWQPLFEQKYKYYICVKHYLWHDIIHLCQWIFLYDNDISSCQCCVLFYCLLYNLENKVRCWKIQNINIS